MTTAGSSRRCTSCGAASARAAVLIGAAASVFAARPAPAQETRTRLLVHDRFGNTRAPAMPADSMFKFFEGENLIVEWRPTAVFTLQGFDLPRWSTAERRLRTGADTAGRARNTHEMVLYPRDSYLLFEHPRATIDSIQPGNTDVVMMAVSSRNLRIRVERLTRPGLDSLVGSGSEADWHAMLDVARRRCYAGNDSTLRGGAEPWAQVQNAALQRIGSASDPRSVFRIRDVTFASVPTHPYARIEVLQVLPNARPGTRVATDSCDSLSLAAIPATAANIGVAVVKHVVIVQVATGFDAAVVRTEDELDRVARPDMAGVGDPPAAYRRQIDKLVPGTLRYRVCTERRPATGPAETVRCVPSDPLVITVFPPLPSRVRFQPGAIVVNRYRDVRLSAHAVFIMDPEGYFGARRPRVVGGIINPAFGLQLGGDSSQIIVLFGLHVRVIEQAGLVIGARFGAHGSSQPYRPERNLYFGMALDPGLFGRIRSAQP